jgi:hypothetical protein
LGTLQIQRLQPLRRPASRIDLDDPAIKQVRIPLRRPDPFDQRTAVVAYVM